MKLLHIALCVATFSLFGCKSDLEKQLGADRVANPQTQDEKDRNAIIDFCLKNKINAVRDSSGLYYAILTEGTGVNPDVNAQVTTHYEGKLLDGTKFDSSKDRNQPATFPIRAVIPGWQIGIPKIKVGGKARLLIPSSLAYGAQAAGQIPPNSVLDFEVELIDIFDPAKQATTDEEIIKKYIADNKLTMERLPSGLYYKIDKQGKGKTPNVNSQVTTHYKGTLLDGKEFDSSYTRNEPATFPLGGVIRGWQEGIPLLKEGGKGTFLIPSGLAYGTRGAGTDIAPNSVLKFEVELLKVGDAPAHNEHDGHSHDDGHGH